MKAVEIYWSIWLEVDQLRMKLPMQQRNNHERTADVLIYKVSIAKLISPFW